MILKRSSIFVTRNTQRFLSGLEVTDPTPKNSLILCKVSMSLMCKLISKLTITRQFKSVRSRLLIITVKQPSASQKPVIQFGSSLFCILVLLL